MTVLPLGLRGERDYKVRREVSIDSTKRDAEENDAYVLERGRGAGRTRLRSLRVLLQALWFSCPYHWFVSPLSPFLSRVKLPEVRVKHFLNWPLLGFLDTLSGSED